MSAGKNNLLISNEVVGFKVRQPQLCFLLVVTALELSFIFDNHSQYTLLDPDQFSFSHCKPNGQLCFVKQCRIKKIVKNSNVLVEYWNKHIKLYIFFCKQQYFFWFIIQTFYYKEILSDLCSWRRAATIVVIYRYRLTFWQLANRLLAREVSFTEAHVGGQKIIERLVQVILLGLKLKA